VYTSGYADEIALHNSDPSLSFLRFSAPLKDPKPGVDCNG
jgi:hypothetical protein